MNRHGTTIEIRKTEIKSRQRDSEATQDSLNNWDEVKLNSIQGVCVDESVATSTSSVSRITEPAISHLPPGGGDPELFLQREHTMPKAASTIAAGPSTQPVSISTTPVAVHDSSIPTISLPI